MWGYRGSPLEKSFPRSCPCLCPDEAAPAPRLCRLHAPWGGHQHLQSQPRRWTRLTACKWMGKGPTAPSWAGSAVTTAVLALDPTPGKGIQEQTGLYFVFLHGNVVVFVTWILLAVKSASHPLHLARPAAATSFTNRYLHHFVLCISLAFYHRRMSKEKWLAQESPFFSLR